MQAKNEQQQMTNVNVEKKKRKFSAIRPYSLKRDNQSNTCILFTNKFKVGKVLGKWEMPAWSLTLHGAAATPYGRRFELAWTVKTQ